MRVFFLMIFLTFVVNTPHGSAAPNTTTEMEALPYEGQDDPLLRDKEYLANLEKPPQYQLTTSLGYGGGHYLEKDQYVIGPYLRIAFAPLENFLPDWDYSGEVNTENLIGVFIGKRWYCCPEDEYLPYYRLSAGSYLDADAGLANFVEIKRLRARAAWGFGKHFVTEIGVGWAVAGSDYYLQFGFPWEF